MKKFLPIFLVLIILLSGCSFDNTNEKEEEKLSIVATIFPQYDFLREITKGADVDLKMLISPGMEVHGFETTLSDIATVAESDLFVYVGGEDDEWVKNVPESDTKRLALSDIVELTEDDHPWTSPKNAILIVEKLCDTLCEIDSENAELYSKNTSSYVKKLKKLDEGFETVTQNDEINTVVFAERFPFGYMAKDYDLEYYSAFEGCSTETEAGIKTINFLVEKIKEENIPAVFTIEFSDGTVAEKISEATGVEIYQMHSCHNVTEEEFENSETYLSLMQKNLDYLKIALGE